MKRVLQIIGIVCGGGVEAVIMNYYRNIDRTQVQFDFVIDGYEKTYLDDEIEAMGGKVYHVAPYRKNIFRYMGQIYKIVRDGQYKIVHSNMNTLSVFSLFPAWLAGARLRILHNHSTAVKGEGMRTMLKYILRPLAPIFANRYAACSQLAGKWMYGDKLMAAGKVKVLNNAIDIKKFTFDEEKRQHLQKELGIDKDNLVLGHVGRFMYQKNHEFLLDIFAELVKINSKSILILIGEGELRRRMEEKTEQHGLVNKVRFLGLRADVADLYNVMDIFVLPSWYEGLPVVSVEAQANGLPCLVSDMVSKECRLTSNLQFQSLLGGSVVWAKIIAKMNHKRNPQAAAELRKNNFDISSEAGELMEWYELEQRDDDANAS